MINPPFPPSLPLALALDLRDVKGANVLVSAEGTMKLADFGASKRLGHDSVISGLKVRRREGGGEGGREGGREGYVFLVTDMLLSNVHLCNVI